MAADRIGGIETSGRLAWQGIADFPGRPGEREGLSPYLFCYERLAEAGSGLGRRYFAHTRSKLRTVMAALDVPNHFLRALVWHIDLLKLLPCFDLSGAKVALFLHGVEAWRSQRWSTRFLLRRVQLFLSNSDFTWQRFLAFNPGFEHTPHITVPLGVDVIDDGPALPPRDPPAILMLGRLSSSEDYKGHREMIQAWPFVLKRIPRAELWIAGDGSLRADLQAMIRSSALDERVRFWGEVSEAQKQDLLAQCSALALPSRGEGFGVVYLEAMRLGRPCLVSTIDAGREVVNPPEAGLAVHPENLSELAQAVCRLVTPGPEWEQWSAQARRRYARYFTAEKFQQRLLSALLEV